MSYQPNPWMIAPFVVLLVLIAVTPLWWPHWWTRHYGKVALALAALTLGYYVFVLPRAALFTVTETVDDYLGFMALVGALYIIAGGIHIDIEGQATPWRNVVFLAVGALLANVAGNVGASMLLIRPWLRFNRSRPAARHVVFFIFIVSNVGGSLTPMGPPLFLGFLKGVPFWWVVKHCWAEWAVAMAFLLGVFFLIDHAHYRRRRPVIEAEKSVRWKIDGLGNVLLMALICVAMFVPVDWLRAALMFGAAGVSYITTRKAVHESNEFDFAPVIEVAVLFAGIFGTMMPALDWLKINAQKVVGGNPSAALFFWWPGTLSSFLDNAPSYLSFLAAMTSSLADPAKAARAADFLARGGGAQLTAPDSKLAEMVMATLKYFPAQCAAGKIEPQQVQLAMLLSNSGLAARLPALSVASVFFGGNTYIGNGPNFMVKSIADQRGAPSPGFLGYIIKWTVPVMVPLLILEWLIFFR